MQQLNKEDIQAIAKELHRLQTQQDGQKNGSKCGLQSNPTRASATNEKKNSVSGGNRNPTQSKNYISKICKALVSIINLALLGYVLSLVVPYIIN